MLHLIRQGMWLLAATAFAGTTAVAQTSQDLVVRTTESGTEISVGTRAPFHRTDREVRDAELIGVPSSVGHVALWTELDAAGNELPFYAISKNGNTMATVKQTSYDVMLRRSRFDPLDFEPDFAGSALPGSENLHIVQFVTQPLNEYRDALEQLGATVYSFVANHAHIVHMNADVKERVSDLPFVRWVGPYHPEYRLEEELLVGLSAGELTEARYWVMVFERGVQQQDAVATRIQALGGTVHEINPLGVILDATMSPEALAAVAAFDEVLWIDRWSDIETDMNIVRSVGGANYLEGQTGFTGVDVRGEVMDVGTHTGHQEFAADTPNVGQLALILHDLTGTNSHGTATTGIVFGHGTNATARGMVPDAQGIAASALTGGARYSHTARLVNPNLVYKAVFQSNSWGTSTTSQYNSQSSEMDDIIFINDIVICQSQSNTGSTLSRPQAWAKNVVAVGGISHFNTTTKNDDRWTSASIGPAADGRLKPDLSYWYDNIFTSTGSSGCCSYTSSFGGTSAATPEACGHFGLMFQMWDAGLFNNPTPGNSVFENRPHSTTSKALMINTASSYDFTGSNHVLARKRQGWGLPDVRTLYDERDNTYVVDETDVLEELDATLYTATVAAGVSDFKVTLCYLDFRGTTSSSQHRINDLDLKVTAPDGTIYHGNTGLDSGNESVAGGSANTKDTVENVWIVDPMAGDWEVEIIASEINADTHTETPAMDADYALVIRGADEVDTFVCDPVTTYCTAKSGLFCGTPVMGFIGAPDASETSGFFVFAGPARANKAGVLVYSDAGRAAIPFQGGLLCVNPQPLRRAVPTNSGGTGNNCDGEFLMDMNAFASGQSGGNPAAFLLIPGTVVNGQFWGRDTVQTGSFLSDAIEYMVCP